ncbi:hypothetical protein DES30_11217 [Prauserella marina]|uniref:hypothetical protein n=1 Tax=Prauserella marina TaxID=530584 RepID=UPI000B89ED8A|nr:hypothetical protein [Prauserella marina]PWV71301.1 hypothetical protein DES30_11217 [Prauserella marina]
MTTSGDGPRVPGPGPGPGDEASETGAVLDEVAAAFAGARVAMDNLRRTWDTGLAETLRQLDQICERTDQLVAQVTGNLDLLRRVTNRR